ncbi:HD-GYP domain-containing protein [Alteromonas sp. KUL49]|uniref:HD-GYP domain-containing protein n=1 Tax=Alteromonas sp. KUL49 TaxID=2480798 RepID=UPI00102F2715|nr:HD-GYP domain-containing protein [Alteromonas sp. KUL49]TAP34982.1 HD-GYP domain-containing protein [Alteromonas sp. KUL49]GEA13422.1 phosphodiesterase [Alteromonas sp. KUL49]
MLKNVPIHDLEPGMYVNQVIEQRGTLKMRSKGLVKTTSVIASLKDKGILVVEVDYSKSSIAPPPPPVEEETLPEKSEVKQSPPISKASLSNASDLYTDAVNIQNGFVESLKRGAAKDLKPLEDLSQSLIESMFDNRDALSCLTMIKNADAYLLEHSINCSILMGMFLEHLGYDRDTIEEACLGALLMDVGMSTLPEDIRNSTSEYTPADREMMKMHTEIGQALVEQSGEISDLALSIIANHHERVDGSGYPRGIEGDDIPEFARIAGIIDTYDAMTSNRCYRKSITPSQALKRLSKDSSLDQNLVSTFIKCIGVHPVGSVVRLKSGKLGIVSQQGKEDMLSPVVMTFYSATSNHYNEIKRLDLSLVDDEIVSGVRPDDFNINLGKFFREVFVHQMPDK